ncbi:MAG: hypothetical protein IPP33_14805 [Flavobacteriales bacterium]|nr:hypothetical protein [Flavobacteriales bacterium]
MNHYADATPDRYIKKAVERKSVPIATLLLAKGADANNGVLLAIQKNDLDMVTLLKSNNGDLSRAGYLAASVGFDNFPLSTLIVDAGCPVQEGVDPAVTAGAGKVMGLLVDKGADVKNVDLIVRAVNGAFPGVVEALLRERMRSQGTYRSRHRWELDARRRNAERLPNGQIAVRRRSEHALQSRR